MRIKPDQLTDIGDFVITRCPPRVGMGKPVHCRPDPYAILAPKVTSTGAVSKAFKATTVVATFNSRDGVKYSDAPRKRVMASRK